MLKDVQLNFLSGDTKEADCYKAIGFFRQYGRSGETRTRGIQLPKLARYQLRYTPTSNQTATDYNTAPPWLSSSEKGTRRPVWLPCPRYRGVFYYAVGLTRWTRWAIPGMLSPCWEEVGDIRAPVPTNRTLDSSFRSIFPRIWEQSTAAEQPQPEPPA